MRLPVLGEHGPETALCTYCPKLCRPACPVATAEGRETVTPWGKMRAMNELIRGSAPLDVAHFAPAYACTGCLRCFELCEIDNPVAPTLRYGRADAVSLGHAPDTIKSFLEGFSAREENLARRASAIAPSATSTARTAWFPGCTAVTFERATVDPLRRVVAQLTSTSCAAIADACCGLPLIEAGDRDGFVVRARALAARLERFERVVVGDAGCAHAMRVIYPHFGIRLPKVEHLAETAAGALGRVPRLSDPPSRVVYHDACRLGRGLGVYDEPRAVLSRLLGEAPGELPEKREHGACSGGGGLVPVTAPETAARIAGDLASLVREVGGETVVTACASSRKMLLKAGVRAMDLGELLVRAMP